MSAGFYPAPHPGVVHSLTDESISVEALRDAGNGTDAETSSTAAGSSTTAAPPTSNKDEEEVIDNDGEKPVSIAQVRGSADNGKRDGSVERAATLLPAVPALPALPPSVAVPVRVELVGAAPLGGVSNGVIGGAAVRDSVPAVPAVPVPAGPGEVLLEAFVLGEGVLKDGSASLDEDAWQVLRDRFGPDVAVVLVSDGQEFTPGDARRRPLSQLSKITRVVIRVAYNQLVKPSLGGLGGIGGIGGIGGLGGGLLG